MKYLLLLSYHGNWPNVDDSNFSGSCEEEIDCEPGEVKHEIQSVKDSLESKIKEEHYHCVNVTITLKQVLPLG